MWNLRSIGHFMLLLEWLRIRERLAGDFWGGTAAWWCRLSVGPGAGDVLCRSGGVGTRWRHGCGFLRLLCKSFVPPVSGARSMQTSNDLGLRVMQIRKYSFMRKKSEW